MPKRKYVPVEAELPQEVTLASGEIAWRGHFGEAVVKRGIPAPEARSLQADMYWLLDNVLKAGECMDIGRNYDQVRVQVARYIRERRVPRGTIKVRPLEKGRCRVWKLAAGYEKPG